MLPDRPGLAGGHKISLSREKMLQPRKRRTAAPLDVESGRPVRLFREWGANAI
ncbi:hypothetical protein DVDV_1594 [Desulfovibrio sp. DV]|nr:hypothetical protein DVDV_1594 [Desulfovibrio sp. DV]